MNRRNFLATTALAAMPLALPRLARAAADPNRLNQDLTPLGAERAASASGNVPAWTGGITALPTGASATDLPPDMFPGESPKFTVTAANMSQYAAMLSDGQKQMLQRFAAQGYALKVYPTHRTAAAPQYVYDNAFKNVTRAKPADRGILYGFQGAVGGPPFPILSDDPAVAGSQAIWNHICRWQGSSLYTYESEWVVGSNDRSLTGDDQYWFRAPYYDPDMTPEKYDANPIVMIEYVGYVAPANQVGGKVMAFFSSNLDKKPDTAYQYLVGMGRVRQLPGTEYDIPASQFADATDYDEVWLWSGAQDRYTWKLVGKQEMIVPYNCHSMFVAQPNDAMGLQTVNQDLVRYEIHRCWVVEAHLAPGKRHAEPVRRFYIDEDTWIILLSDAYDDKNNYWKFGQMYLEVVPALPGTVQMGVSINNLQSAEYTYEQPFYKAPKPMGNGAPSYDKLPMSLFVPQSMANSGGL